jgi:hypothetical protein
LLFVLLLVGVLCFLFEPGNASQFMKISSPSTTANQNAHIIRYPSLQGPRPRTDRGSKREAVCSVYHQTFQQVNDQSEKANILPLLPPTDQLFHNIFALTMPNPNCAVIQPWLELTLWDPLAHIQRQKIAKFQLSPTVKKNGTVRRPKLEFQHGGLRGQNSSFGHASSVLTPALVGISVIASLPLRQ